MATSGAFDFLLGSHEKNYIVDGMKTGIRNDGRRLTDYRPISLETGVIANANGSARVQIGSTDVLVAVKAELTTVEKDDEEARATLMQRIKFFVDISANASPKFTGRGGNELAEEFARTLQTAFGAGAGKEIMPGSWKKLLIAPPTHFWTLYADAVVLQHDGNVMDALSLGVKAALFDTEICNVIVRPADEGKVLIDLPDETSIWRLEDVESAPLVVAVNRIGDKCVFDADLAEEHCANSTLFVGVQTNEQLITCVKKVLGGSLEANASMEMIEQTARVARNLDAALMQKLKVKEEERKKRLFPPKLF